MVWCISPTISLLKVWKKYGYLFKIGMFACYFIKHIRKTCVNFKILNYKNESFISVIFPELNGRTTFM